MRLTILQICASRASVAVHGNVYDLQLQVCRRFHAQCTSIEVRFTWQEVGGVEGALSAMLQRMPRLDKLQLLISCTVDDNDYLSADKEAHAQPLTDAVLRLPGSFWQCACALSSLTLALQHGHGFSGGHLDGNLHVTMPASQQLKELVVHARLLTLEFEDLQRSAASLDTMRLIYLERFGLGQSALEEAFAQSGLRLMLCHLDAKSYNLWSDEAVQYTCMYNVGCNGAKPQDVKKVPCVCGACYRCVLIKFQLK